MTNVEWDGDLVRQLEDNPVESDNPFPETPAEPTLAEIAQALTILDKKLNWCMAALQRHDQIFAGIQSVATMLPGKGGKMARDMMRQMNGENT